MSYYTTTREITCPHCGTSNEYPVSVDNGMETVLTDNEQVICHYCEKEIKLES